MCFCFDNKFYEKSDKIMSKHKNTHIKYKRAELEEYIKHPESCVKKVRTTEALRFAPDITPNFCDSIMKILSKKIGKYDANLDGVVLDFRKTKILNTSSVVRNDSVSNLINIESDFYIFSPRQGAVVDGVVKHINHNPMETIISVVIYRVFNVKVIFKRQLKNNIDVHHNQEIKIRIKDFHFDNVIPYIEGEMIMTGNETTRKKINFDEAVDSGISESSFYNDIIIKQEKPDDDPSTSSRKRKRQKEVEDEYEEQHQQPTKKVRKDPILNVTIKQEKNIEIKGQNVEIETPSNSSKKKKKKKRNSLDDFESSLLGMMFSSPQIKQEKN